MKIKTTISFHEYLRLIYGLLYSKIIMKFLVAVALLIILWIVFYYLHIAHLPKPVIYQYITLALISIVQPGIIYMTIWKNYHSSNHLRETLHMEFTSTELKITGDSFYMEIFWEKMFKIVEEKHWFMVYQNNLSAIVIDKKDLTQAQVIRFRELLRELPKVSVSLLE